MSYSGKNPRIDSPHKCLEFQRSETKSSEILDAEGLEIEAFHRRRNHLSMAGNLFSIKPKKDFEIFLIH